MNSPWVSVSLWQVYETALKSRSHPYHHPDNPSLGWFCRVHLLTGKGLKIPAEPSPELRIPGAAAQTRVVSMAGIRLDSRKSVRSFKGIICVDISEFESYMPSHAVGSLWRV